MIMAYSEGGKDDSLHFLSVCSSQYITQHSSQGIPTTTIVQKNTHTRNDPCGIIVVNMRNMSLTCLVYFVHALCNIREFLYIWPVS